MAFAKFQENRFRIDGEIAENHAILVNLTASMIYYCSSCRHGEMSAVFLQFKKKILDLGLHAK